MGKTAVKLRRTEKRKLRDRKAMALAGCGVGFVLLLAGATAWLTMPGANRTGDSIGGPFALVADDGRTVTNGSFPGKFLAIYFGYTHCQDVCPATLTNLSAAMARLGRNANGVQPIFITVDPERDSPSVLHHFLSNFSSSVVGLTGTAAELGKVSREYHVVAIENRTPAHTAGYTVDHSSVIYLMDPNGHFVAPIPADASEMVMAQAMAHYLNIPL